MPVLNLSENSLDVTGQWTTALAGVDNRNRRRRDVVREIGLRFGFRYGLKIEADRLMRRRRPMYSDEHWFATRTLNCPNQVCIVVPWGCSPAGFQCVQAFHPSTIRVKATIETRMKIITPILCVLLLVSCVVVPITEMTSLLQAYQLTDNGMPSENPVATISVRPMLDVASGFRPMLPVIDWKSGTTQEIQFWPCRAGSE